MPTSRIGFIIDIQKLPYCVLRVPFTNYAIRTTHHASRFTHHVSLFRLKHFFPIHPRGHLHHHCQRDNRADGDDETSVALVEKRIREQNKEQELRNANFAQREFPVRHAPDVGHDEQERDERGDDERDLNRDMIRKVREQQEIGRASCRERV